MEIFTILFLNHSLHKFEQHLTKNLSTSMPHIIIYTNTPKRDYNVIIKNLNHYIEGINIFYFLNKNVEIQSSEFRKYKGEVRIIGIDIDNYPIGIDISSINTKELLYYSIRLTDIQFLYMMKNNKFIFINRALNSLFHRPLVFQSPFYIDKNKFIFDGIIYDNSNKPSIFMSLNYFKKIYSSYNKGIYIRVKNLNNLEFVKEKLELFLPKREIKLFFENNKKDKNIISSFNVVYKGILYFIVFFFVFITFIYFFFIYIRTNKTIIYMHYLGCNVNYLLIYSCIFLIIEFVVGLILCIK